MSEKTTQRCTCRDRLVDWTRGLVIHPYRDCPHFGVFTPLDEPETDQ